MDGDYLFTINNTNENFIQLFNCLRGLDDSILNHLFKMIVVEQHAEQQGIVVDNDEITTAVNAFRISNDLKSADSFKKYLKERKISIRSLKKCIKNKLVVDKLTDAVSDEKTDAYIIENQLKLEQVELYTILLDNEDTANEIKELLNDDEMNFPGLAYEHSLDEKTRKQGGYLGFLTRNEVTAEIEADIFNAKPGDVIGPYQTKNGYNIFMINQSRKPNKDDPQLRYQIKQQLLKGTIQHLLSSADIHCPFYE